MTPLDELRQIALRAEGTTRVNWSPDDALAVLERLAKAEGLAGRLLWLRTDSRLETNAEARREVADYVANYYPGKSVDVLWPTGPKGEAP